MVNKILINTLPLTNKKNLFLEMKELTFEEGLSLNTFGEKYNFEGKKFNIGNSYKILGTTIDFLVEKKIMKVPDYIKIDVDGIEHLILKGGSETLKNIKSLLVEVDDTFEVQKKNTTEYLEKAGFKLIKKAHSELFDNSQYSTCYNQIWIKN